MSSTNSTEGIQVDAHTASTSSFLTSLVFNVAVFAAELLAFTILRKYFKTIYEPRTFLTPEGKRVKPLSPTLWDWPRDIFLADEDQIRQQNGLDAYMFVRFLRMIVKILVPIWFFSWSVLLPINSVKTGTPNHEGLDKFTFGNIAPQQTTKRYSAHIILAWLSTFWILYVLRSELRQYITLRQKHLIDPNHASTAQANTVLVTGVPQKYLTEQALRELFKHAPGGVRKVWLNRDLGDLPDVYDRRLAACNKLESAEHALLKTAMKIHNKGVAKGNTGNMEKTGEEGTLTAAHRIVPASKRPSHRLGSIPFFGTKVDTIEWCKAEILECNELLERERRILYSEIREAKRKQRLLHFPGSGQLSGVAGKVTGQVVGGVGKVAGQVKGVAGRIPGVKTRQGPGHNGEQHMIEEEYEQHPSFEHEPAVADYPPSASHPSPHSASQLHASSDPLSPEEDDLDTLPDPSTKYPALNSAFILFNSQIGAHVASQALTHAEPFRMVDKYIELAPDDVVWGNLGLNPYEMLIRKLISVGLTTALIVGWAIPVAFVGIVSNIHALCSTYKWLAWLCKIPSVVIGIIQGILPSVLLAVLFMLLPIVLRMLARFEGIPTRTGIEMSLMTKYFSFLVIHGFLVVSISSGIIAALPNLLKNPGSIPSLLASNLPSASTFFLTYIILQGLTGTAGGFLTIVPLVLYYVKMFILGSTPRSIYNIKYTLRDVAWGTLFPQMTLLVVITFAYAIIAPIINGLACFVFFLFYMLYKYLFLWQLGMSESGDTGGLFFPKAIQHVFVGLYVQQLVLAVLFFLAQDEHHKQSGIPEGALMIVLLAVTIFANYIINASYSPLLRSLPFSLADRAHALKTDHTEALAAAQHSETSPLAHDPNSGSSEPPIHSRNDGPTDFEHPAVRTGQRPIWIAQDPLGVGVSEVGELVKGGVYASCVHATMYATGKVEVEGEPPVDAR